MTKAYVHGVGLLTGPVDPALSLERFIFDGVTAALTDAAIPISRIDSVVLAAHDMIDGRSLSTMVTAPPAGAYMRDEIRLSEDGLAALSLAALRIEAGESDWAIVAAWGRSSEGDYRKVSQHSFDPFFSQPFGVDDFSVSAFRENAWRSRYGEMDGRAAARSLAQARINPRSAKLAVHAGDRPQTCDCVAAMIIGREPSAIRLAGLGHGTDFSQVGDRDLLAMAALRDAFAMAGGQGREFDVYEIDGATVADEALATEILGLSGPGGGFATYADDVRFNPSGGNAAGWAYPTNGLHRAIEACLQMQGRAGAVQLNSAIRSACVSGLSPVGGQVATVALLEAA